MTTPSDLLTDRHACPPETGLAPDADGEEAVLVETAADLAELDELEVPGGVAPV